MSAGHLELGRKGEKAAEIFLRQKGFKVLARNWSCRQGELDLVCQDGDYLVFVEVKTRKQGSRSLPGQALTIAKQKKLFKAATAYLAACNGWDSPCRFDFVAVIQAPQGLIMEHEQNVITNTMGGCNSSWQPW